MSNTPNPKFLRCRGAMPDSSYNPKVIRAPQDLSTAADRTFAQAGDVLYKRVGVVREVTESGEVLPFEVGKTYKTQDGGEFRVLALDGPNSNEPLVAMGKHPAWTHAMVTTFSKNGQFGLYKSVNDLIPETKPGKTSLTLVEDAAA